MYVLIYSIYLQQRYISDLIKKRYSFQKTVWEN